MPGDYDAAFDAAESTLRFFLSNGRPVGEPPGSLLAELSGLADGSESDGVAPTPERRALPFLVRWLIEKSHSCRYASPGEMLQWGLMARLAAQTCSAGIAGNTRKLSDLRAAAEAQLANTLRLLGRSGEANEVMRSAFDHLSRGTGSAELRAGMLQKSASLLIFQRRIEAGIECLDEVADIFSDLGMREELAQAEVVRAIAYRDSGQSGRAAGVLERAMVEIDSAEDPYLPLLARNNLVVSYIDIGRYTSAMEMILAAPSFVRDRERQESLLLALKWQQGRLLVASGLPETAELMLSRARAGFLKQKHLWPLCGVTRDLAALQKDLGHHEAAARSVAETLRVVEAQRNGPEIGQELQQLRAIVL